MMQQTNWYGKPYYSLDAWCKNTYGHKLYKIALETGCTCPNRDGTLGSGGCIFCSSGGSGDFAIAPTLSVHEQLQAGKRLLRRKWQPNGDSAADGTVTGGSQPDKHSPSAAKAVPSLIAYFQSYTNTYGNPDRLCALFEEALMEPEVAGISIGTRPDCLPEAILSGLDRLAAAFPDKFIWIELGLQTIHDRTASLIHRGYDYPVFEQAFETLSRHKLPVIVHTILGLPGETHEDILATIYTLSRLHPFGIKLQLLHILKDTVLAQLYEAGEASALEKEEYLTLLCDCVAALSPDICIHRITGDGPKELLIAPLWSLRKRDVLNSIHARMKQKNIRQGMNYESGNYHLI